MKYKICKSNESEKTGSIEFVWFWWMILELIKSFINKDKLIIDLNNNKDSNQFFAKWLCDYKPWEIEFPEYKEEGDI